LSFAIILLSGVSQERNVDFTKVITYSNCINIQFYEKQSPQHVDYLLNLTWN